jgi:hypothetical protein
MKQLNFFARFVFKDLLIGHTIYTGSNSLLCPVTCNSFLSMPLYPKVIHDNIFFC